MTLVDLGGGLRHLRLVANIAGERLGFHRLQRRLERRLAAPRNHHLGTGLCQLDGGGEADARAAAGDPGNFIVEHIASRRTAPPRIAQVVRRRRCVRHREH